MKVVNVFLWFLLISLYSCGVQFEPVGNYSDYDVDQKNRDRSIDLHPNRGAPLNAEEGKCYAKCLILDIPKRDSLVLLEYTGANYESPFVQLKDTLLVQSGEKWVEKSSGSEDMVWCLVEVPEERYSFFEVLDTSKIKDYKVVVKYLNVTEQASEFNEWREVVCQRDITPSFIADIEAELYKLGYLTKKVNDGVDSAFIKSALAKYQKNHGLPVGNFNYETLNHLFNISDD